MYLGDPELQFALHDMELEEKLKKRPKCHFCKEHIQEEYGYELPVLGWCCMKCIDDFMKEIPEDDIKH